MRCRYGSISLGTAKSTGVDVGTGEDQDDSAPVAKEALALMAVCINSTWKVPPGYFLIDGVISDTSK